MENILEINDKVMANFGSSATDMQKTLESLLEKMETRTTPEEFLEEKDLIETALAQVHFMQMHTMIAGATLNATVMRTFLAYKKPNKRTWYGRRLR